MYAWHSGTGQHFQANSSQIPRTRVRTISDSLVPGGNIRPTKMGIGTGFRKPNYRKSVKILLFCFLFAIIVMSAFVFRNSRKNTEFGHIKFLDVWNYDFDEEDVWNLEHAKKLYFEETDEYENGPHRTCKIPQIYPYKETAFKLIQRQVERKQLRQPSCLFTLEWFTTNLQSKLIRLQETSPHWHKVECYYLPFKIFNGHVEISVAQQIDIKEIVDQVPINEDYKNIIVQCTHKDSGRLAYNGIFDFLRLNETLEKAATETTKELLPNGTDYLSVIYLGLESVSYTNFQRFLPKTRDFLMWNLSAVEFTGYNSVGRDRTHNLDPVIDGCNSLSRETKPRECRFIWDKYADKGYRTILTQDKPSRTLQHSTHYDNSEALSALHQTCPDARSASGCFENQFMPNRIADRIIEVAKKLNETPYYHHAWSSLTTGFELSYAKYWDNILLQMLKELQANWLLNNTVLILSSDRGMVDSDYSRSADGLVEARNPMLYMVFPAWFGNYSEAMGNLYRNSRGLTTPYDLHKSLNDLLNLHSISNMALKQPHKPGTLEIGPGTSLFRPIPLDRTCEMASVSKDYCLCQDLPDTNRSTEDINIILAVSVTLDYMNRELEDFKQCHTLDLKKIMYGKVQRNDYGELLYEIGFQVLPSHYIFSAVLKRQFLSYREEDSEFVLVGDIQRLNDHENYSTCLGFFRSHFGWLRTVCYCK